MDQADQIVSNRGRGQACVNGWASSKSLPFVDWGPHRIGWTDFHGAEDCTYWVGFVWSTGCNDLEEGCSDWSLDCVGGKEGCSGSTVPGDSEGCNDSTVHVWLGISAEEGGRDLGG